MRSRFGGVATVVTAAGLLLGLVFVGLAMMRPALPDPEVADREQLIRWLVVRDISGETPRTREVLARRLEEEFSSGVDWEATRDRLDAAQRERLWANVLLLIDPWLQAKVERYFELSKEDRPAYLDQILDTLAAWRGIESLRPQPAGASGGSQGGLLAAVLERVERWKARAEPRQAERIGEFLGALQFRWLKRALGLTPKAAA